MAESLGFIEDFAVGGGGPTRTNLAENPSAKNNVTGFGLGTVAQTIGLTGYSRTTGARFTAGSTLRLPPGNASFVNGEWVTISFDVLSETFGDNTVDLYLCKPGDVAIGAADAITVPVAATVYRRSISRQINASGVTQVYALLDSINSGTSPVVITGVLIERAPTPAGTYFDGDSPGGTWLGTNGNSASTI